MTPILAKSPFFTRKTSSRLLPAIKRLWILSDNVKSSRRNQHCSFLAVMIGAGVLISMCEKEPTHRANDHDESGVWEQTRPAGALNSFIINQSARLLLSTLLEIRYGGNIELCPIVRMVRARCTIQRFGFEEKNTVEILRYDSTFGSPDLINSKNIW